ncbi:MAG: taurine dioxygenase [Candidatus Poriferisodalaceae bacterium]|jgi:taurine dioxygenase
MEIRRLGPVFGAELTGIDLGGDLDDEDVAAIETALAENGVIVFRAQELASAQQLDLGRRFGELVVSPFSPNADDAPEVIVLDYGAEGRAPLTDIWHADETYRPAPPKFTMLKSVISPELGGDTMFCSMKAAYAGLSDRMQAHIAGLTALHGFGRFQSLAGSDPERVARRHQVELDLPHPNHPVVAVHPVTGHKVLYVNRHFTERINELPEDEGRAILEFLLQQTARPEHQLRVSWQPGTVVMWDNRSVQHYAGHDYWPQRRRMERVTIAGTRPIGDGESAQVTVERTAVIGVSAGEADSALSVPTREYDR